MASLSRKYICPDDVMPFQRYRNTNRNTNKIQIYKITIGLPFTEIYLPGRRQRNRSRNTLTNRNKNVLGKQMVLFSRKYIWVDDIESF